MSAWRYWEEVIIRTFRATRQSLGWNAQTAVVVIVSLLALAGRWAIQGLPKASEDALQMLLYAVLPALVFLVFALLYHLTHVPPIWLSHVSAERDAAAQTLSDIRAVAPRLVIIGARTVQKEILYRRELLGSPYVLQVEFQNAPLNPVETAIATELYAEVFWCRLDGVSLFDHLPGRWENSPPPTSENDPVALARLGIGERRTLDLAIQHPGARMFAFTNRSYGARDWQYSSLALGATDQAWRVRVHLWGPRVDQSFDVAIIDNPDSGRPPMIYTTDLDRVLRDHPAMRAWRSRFRVEV